VKGRQNKGWQTCKGEELCRTSGRRYGSETAVAEANGRNAVALVENVAARRQETVQAVKVTRTAAAQQAARPFTVVVGKPKCARCCRAGNLRPAATGRWGAGYRKPRCVKLENGRPSTVQQANREGRWRWRIGGTSSRREQAKEQYMNAARHRTPEASGEYQQEPEVKGKAGKEAIGAGASGHACKQNAMVPHVCSPTVRVPLTSEPTHPSSNGERQKNAPCRNTRK